MNILSQSSIKLFPGMPHDEAQAHIAAFKERFGLAHLDLACHAAFPLSMTPDLLYTMWGNFQYDNNGNFLKIEWIAVSDLLLSNLCNEVGRELFEMDRTVRAELLQRLKADERFGPSRLTELANFLLAYVDQQLTPSNNWRDHHLAQVQRWTAWAYTDPKKAESELAQAFAVLPLNKQAELIRLASIVEIFNEYLPQDTKLWPYAQGVAHLAYGNQEQALDYFNQVFQAGQTTTLIGSSVVLSKPIYVSQIQGLTQSNPYYAYGPTPLNMFYNREQELRQIIERIGEASFAILGARRIGKTSFIHQILERLKPQEKVVFYLDCQILYNETDFYERLVVLWKQQLGLPDTEKINSETFFDHLPNLLPDRQIVFLFDEIDQLIVADSQGDYKLSRRLRALSQNKHCQFIVTGERILLQALQDPNSPWFNFVYRIPLGLFNQEATNRLVEKPMSSLGIHFEQREEILTLIFEQTSGHPNLIQFLCNNIVEELDRAKVITVTIDVVQKIAQSVEFRDRYIETFWSASTEIERAMTIFVIEEKRLTTETLRKRLREAGVTLSHQELQSSLNYLVLCQLLTDADGYYSIQPRNFLEFLKTNSQELLAYYLAEYKKEQPVEPMSQPSFVTRGPIQHTSPTYISRSIEQEIFNTILTRGSAVIIGPRQIGKTSLLLKIGMTFPSQYNFATAYIDLATFNVRDLSETTWVKQLCDYLVSQLGEWIRGELYFDSPSNIKGLKVFFDILASRIEVPKILILLDEAASIPIEIRTRFYSFLRSWIIQSRSNFCFVIAGVFVPSDLISNLDSSPFNVSEVFYLPDFSLEEVEELLGNLNEIQPIPNITELAQTVFDWTSGQPYLSQQLTALLADKLQTNKNIALNIPLVETLIHDLLDEDSNHMPSVIGLSTKKEQYLSLLRRILAGEQIRFSRTNRLIVELELIGVLKSGDGNWCQIRNRVYETALRRLQLSEEDIPTPSESQRLYQLLLGFNYNEQVKLFQEVMKTRSIAAFLIQGLQEDGLQWLTNRLIKSLPDYQTTKILQYQYPNSFRIGVDWVWNKLGEYLGYDHSVQISKIIDHISTLTQRENLVFVFRADNGANETEWALLLDEFWKPLVTQVAQAESEAYRNKDGRLLMFLISSPNVEIEQSVYFARPNKLHNAEIPIILPKITPISYGEMASWLRNNSNILLPELTYQPDQTIQDIVENSRGEPELVMRHFAKLSGVNWHEIEKLHRI